MLKSSLARQSRAAAAAVLLASAAPQMGAALVSSARAQSAATIKTRLDHLSGTPYILVVSYLGAEITTITCDKWAVLGVESYKKSNPFTIPAGPAIGILTVDSSFNGYCKTPGSLVAHTDLGDFPGTLDRGPGNWTTSTKLTFGTPR